MRKGADPSKPLQSGTIPHDVILPRTSQEQQHHSKWPKDCFRSLNNHSNTTGTHHTIFLSTVIQPVTSSPKLTLFHTVLHNILFSTLIMPVTLGLIIIWHHLVGQLLLHSDTASDLEYVSLFGDARQKSHYLWELQSVSLTVTIWGAAFAISLHCYSTMYHQI